MLQAFLLSRLRRGGAEAFVWRALGVGLLFLLNVVIARAVGVTEFGIFSYALTIAAILSFVTPLGFPTVILRLLPVYVERGEWGRASGLLRRASHVVLVAALAVSLVLLAASEYGGAAGQGLLFAAWLTPMFALYEYLTKGFRGLHRVREGALFDQVFVPAAVIAWVLSVGVRDAATATGVYVAAGVGILVAAAWRFFRVLPRAVLTANPVYDSRSWTKAALPMATGGVGQILLNRSDLIVLGFLADAATVGIYAAASRLAMLATFGLQSINFVAAPLLAASFHGGRIPEFRNLLNTSMRYSSLWAFPVCLLAFLAPQQLLGLFGAEFRGGVEVLQILSIGQCVNAVTGTTGIALMMIGRETAVAASIGVALVVSVMLQIWTWPVFGIAGVAVVSAGCVAALNLLHWFLVRAVANRSALP